MIDESTFEGARGKGSIKASGGYATQFGAEAALLDFPWLFTTLVAHSERNVRRNTSLSAVTIAFDGQTPDTLVTGRVLEAKADYLGTEVIQVMDHAIKAHKFHVAGGGSRDLPDLESTVWVADSGLLLALDWIDERWELTRFLQREKLVPELPVEDDASVAIRNSGQFEGQESIRVQRALWVEAGGREEAMYQALHDAGLVEVEQDKFGISRRQAIPARANHRCRQSGGDALARRRIRLGFPDRRGKDHRHPTQSPIRKVPLCSLYSGVTLGVE